LPESDQAKEVQQPIASKQTKRSKTKEPVKSDNEADKVSKKQKSDKALDVDSLAEMITADRKAADDKFAALQTSMIEAIRLIQPNAEKAEEE